MVVGVSGVRAVHVDVLFVKRAVNEVLLSRVVADATHGPIPRTVGRLDEKILERKLDGRAPDAERVTVEIAANVLAIVHGVGDGR